MKTKTKLKFAKKKKEEVWGTKEEQRLHAPPTRMGQISVSKVGKKPLCFLSLYLLSPGLICSTPTNKILPRVAIFSSPFIYTLVYMV